MFSHNGLNHQNSRAGRTPSRDNDHQPEKWGTAQLLLNMSMVRYLQDPSGMKKPVKESTVEEAEEARHISPLSKLRRKKQSEKNV